MHETRTALLKALACGEFLSGTELGEICGVSRTAIAKHIEGLKGVGIDVFSVKGKGYRLSSPLSLLDEVSILKHFHSALNKTDKQLSLSVLSQVDSTNTYLKQHLPTLTSGHAVIAESQSAGRGRHGRTWISPFATSIYLSMYWRFGTGYQALSGLSLVIGLAVVDTLTEIGIPNAKLKWPNDVYINMQKIAGVLIEVEGAVGDAAHCIIGIGLNVQLPDDITGIEQSYTDIQSHLGISLVDRNKLTAVLLKNMHRIISTFEEKGISPFINRWESLNVFANKGVKLMMGNQSIEGICLGINDDGAIRMQVDGVEQAFHGGEISVRSI